ncbi:hypothetical protein EV127DRAFT_237878 [Xylaria flabelliformis]|nr:hypothetical protein EV127DRAFT_237878 [Xylaria flabelliformis]
MNGIENTTALGWFLLPICSLAYRLWIFIGAVFFRGSNLDTTLMSLSHNIECKFIRFDLTGRGRLSSSFILASHFARFRQAVWFFRPNRDIPLSAIESGRQHIHIWGLVSVGGAEQPTVQYSPIHSL